MIDTLFILDHMDDGFQCIVQLRYTIVQFTRNMWFAYLHIKWLHIFLNKFSHWNNKKIKKSVVDDL